jgi:outer membrane protein TolC
VRNAVGIAFVLLATAVPAAAQGIRLSLDDAVARAVEASHRIAELRGREEAATASADGRTAARLPQVSLQAGYTRTNHVDEFGVPQLDGRLRVIYPDIPDNYRTRVDLVWTLYTGGRLEALERAARADAGAAGHDVRTLRAEVRLETTRAYWAAVTAAETLTVVEQALARTDAHLGDLRARLDQGLIPPNDVLSAEAARSGNEVQVIQARHALELARADLRRLTGIPADMSLELSSPLDAPAAEAEEELAAQIVAAKQARPERAALVERIESADARAAAAGATRLPTVAVGGGVDYARPNPRIFPRLAEWEEAWDVSVNASWSLWDGGRRSAEQAEAEAVARAARARLQEFDSVVELEVRQRRLDVAAGLAAAGAAADGVRSATEARRVVAERFAAGVATSTEVLDAHVAMLQADLDRARALASVRLSEARLARSLGR